MSDPQPPQDAAFPRLTDDQIATFQQCGTPRQLRDGEPLFHAGGRRGGFFVVLAGAIEIIDRTGAEARTVAVHGPREFTGDTDILRHRRPVVSATARGETRLLEIAPADIRRIIGTQPALGELILRAFIARRALLLESGFQGLRVIGSPQSRDAYRIREFLTRNQVPTTWIDADEDAGVGELLRHFGLGADDLPAVALESGPLLRNPSTRALAEAVGLRRPVGRERFDLVIVGAGPAGLAAAVYAASEGLNALVLEGAAPGGQAGASTRIENYLGFPTGISGAELTGRATLQAQRFGARLSVPTLATSLEREDTHLVVHLDGGERATARCVLIATGAEYDRLDVPGRERFDGRGVFYAATPMELSACRGGAVAVVGAGNSAGQAAMFLAEHTERVLLLVRGADMRRSMSSYLADRIDAASNIDVLYHTEVRRLEGADRLERIEIENTSTGERRAVATPAVFTLIGARPHTAWLSTLVATDARGFIETGRRVARSAVWTREREPYLLETSLPGVFAAGDVRLGSVKRVASAVGEGAMAVKFVHEFLAEG